MSVRCPHCGAILHSTESDDKQQLTCWMCTQPTPSVAGLHKAGPPTITLPRAERQKRLGLIGVPRDATIESLALPADKEIKIFVAAGPFQGIELDVLRPWMTIGRRQGGADIEIDDPEVSRSHCVLEVRGDVILLHDLKSRNGTYMGDSRVVSVKLEAMSTFRIGQSLLQIRIGAKSA